MQIFIYVKFYFTFFFAFPLNWCNIVAAMVPKKKINIMSVHDHDPEYYMKNVRTKIAVDNSKSTPEQREMSGYSDEERLGGFIKIYGMAKDMSLREFMQWCDKEDYYFVKPIKTPILKG